jgi:MarR family transcriptional regulator, organic hydroperoxide resistance regulator
VTSSRSSDLTLDQRLCVARQRTARAVTTSYRPLLRAIGLTYSQYAVLLILWEQESVPMRVMCERLQLDSGTVSPLLKRLEAKGALVRRRRTDDERTIQITITPAGRALRPAAEAVQARVQAATGLAAGQLAVLRDELNALATHLLGTQPAPADEAAAS